MVHVSILNDSLAFPNLSPSQRAAFKDGRAIKYYFGPDTEFFKYTQLPVFGPSKFASPWWAAVRPGVVPDQGLPGLLNWSQRQNISPQAIIRARAAVTWEWNTLAHLAIVRLTCPAYGLVGHCRQQKYDLNPQNSNVSWIGGGWQVYLPNLTAADVTLFAPA